MVREVKQKKHQQQPAEEESEEEGGHASAMSEVKSSLQSLKTDMSFLKTAVAKILKQLPASGPSSSSTNSSSSTKVVKKSSSSPSVKKAAAPKPKLVKLGSGQAGRKMSGNASTDDEEEEDEEEEEEIDEKAEFEESCLDFNALLTKMGLEIEDNCPADFFPITTDERGTLIAYQFNTGPDVCRIYDVASASETREPAKYNVRFKVYDHDKDAFPSTFRPVRLEEESYSDLFHPDDHELCKAGSWCVLKKKVDLPTVTPARSKK